MHALIAIQQFNSFARFKLAHSACLATSPLPIFMAHFDIRGAILAELPPVPARNAVPAHGDAASVAAPARSPTNQSIISADAMQESPEDPRSGCSGANDKAARGAERSRGRGRGKGGNWDD